MEWCSAYIAADGNENKMYGVSNSEVFDQWGQVVTDEDRYDDFGRKIDFSRDNTSKHFVFYSAVQAMSYILCFHGVALASEHAEHAVYQSYWEGVIGCPFNPLNYCVQSVRVEFVRLATEVGLVSSAALLSTGDKNNAENEKASPRRTISTPATRLISTQSPVAPRAAMGQGNNPLDSFFPFDPCLLLNLHNAVEDSYRVWDGIPGLDCVVDEESAVSESGDGVVQGVQGVPETKRGQGGFSTMSDDNSMAESFNSIASSMASMSVTYANEMGSYASMTLGSSIPIVDQLYTASYESDGMANSSSYQNAGGAYFDQNNMNGYGNKSNVGGGIGNKGKGTGTIAERGMTGLHEKRPRNFSVGSANGSW